VRVSRFKSAFRSFGAVPQRASTNMLAGPKVRCTLWRAHDSVCQGGTDRTFNRSPVILFPTNDVRRKKVEAGPAPLRNEMFRLVLGIFVLWCNVELKVSYNLVYVTKSGRSRSRGSETGSNSPVRIDSTCEASLNQLGGGVCPQKVARRGSLMLQRIGFQSGSAIM